MYVCMCVCVCVYVYVCMCMCMHHLRFYQGYAKLRHSKRLHLRGKLAGGSLGGDWYR